MSASIVVAGADKRFLDGDGAELMCGRVGESSVEGADRGAGGAGDDDGSGHDLLQTLRACAPDLRTFFGVSTQRVKPEIRDFAMHERGADLCCAA